MKFSIIVVTLNAGDELKKTIDSILVQTTNDYEIIVKDGGSTDGSLEVLKESVTDEKLKIIACPDTGIYDAMNQALELASGEYVYFLNCGDYLYDERVLNTIAWYIAKSKQEAEENKSKSRPLVLYGNIFDRVAGAKVCSNPHIDEFACFRHVPWHQACVFDRDMLRGHMFQTKYKIRADYEQFLWCFFYAKANMIYMDTTVASYQGGGYSETAVNRRISAKEHLEIVENYMPHSHVVKYRWRMRLSMAGLRAVISRNSVLGPLYNRVRTKVYNRNR